MKVKILNIAGMNEALYGFGLSFGKTKELTPEQSYDTMFDRAEKNANLGLGHNKFLESIIAWIEVTGSRAFWSEMDTYRLMTKQSDSTMHTLFKDCFSTENISIPKIEDIRIRAKVQDYLDRFVSIIENINNSCLSEIEKINIAKMLLPEGWQQTRVLCVSYKTLQNIYAQRKNHRLYEWNTFCSELKNLPNAKWIIGKQL